MRLAVFPLISYAAKNLYIRQGTEFVSIHDYFFVDSVTMIVKEHNVELK